MRICSLACTIGKNETRRFNRLGSRLNKKQLKLKEQCKDKKLHLPSNKQPCRLDKIEKLHFIFIEQNTIRLVLSNV